MKWFDKYHDCTIHIVHGEMYRRWLTPGLMTMRDRAGLYDFYNRLQELTKNDIKYVNIKDTNDLHEAQEGDRVVVGGAMWGVCPEEHGMLLEKSGVKVEYSEELSWKGPKDEIDEEKLQLLERGERRI